MVELMSVINSKDDEKRKQEQEERLKKIREDL
jgi:hypothetical protein